MQPVKGYHTEAMICSVLPQQVQRRPRHREPGLLRPAAL